MQETQKQSQQSWETHSFWFQNFLLLNNQDSAALETDVYISEHIESRNKFIPLWTNDFQ